MNYKIKRQDTYEAIRVGVKKHNKMNNNRSFMTKIVIAATIIGIACSCAGVASKTKKTLDFEGSYTGNLPTASGTGMMVTITLEKGAYVKKIEYAGRDGIFENQGRYSLNKKRDIITLFGITDSPNKYLLAENRLIQLDMEGKRITGELADQYVLQRHTNREMTSSMPTFGDATGITNKHWKLVELNGNPVTFPESAVAVFILMNSDGTVSGNLGCNSFSGSFTLQEGNRISFSQLVNTQKMCIDMSIETEMIRVLQSADNYNLNEKQLVLNRARMAPLARFEVINNKY
jgi:heat shock protein HslJ